MTTRDFIYHVSLACTCAAFVILSIGVFHPNWWSLRDVKTGTVKDIYGLYGDIQCSDTFCTHEAATVAKNVSTPGWLLLIQVLGALNFVALLLAIITQVTFIHFQHVYILWASIFLLVFSVILSFVKVFNLVKIIRDQTNFYSQIGPDGMLDIQGLPAVVIFINTPLAIVAGFHASFTLCWIVTRRLKTNY